MIKTIFLHIGVHKTASTTIQNTFFQERAKLLEAGVLYPVFKAGNIAISNHSIPFYSLFREHPEIFHFNQSKGFITVDAIKTIHQEYHQQLQEQLADFDGETLVISGEDISHLQKDELENMKAYLKETTHPGVNIKVVLICRHPVSWFRSALQGSVCAFGLPLQKAVERHLGRTQLFRKLFYAFSEVFGHTQLSLMKYEDAIPHPFGPAGAFLALIDKDLPKKIKPAIIRDNQSRTYEAVTLSDAINRTFPQSQDYELHPERMVVLNRHLSGMPGQKFMLSKGMSAIAWQTLAEDVNWLCREFSLQPYSFLNEDFQESSDIWDGQTLEYLKMVFPNFPDFQKKVFLDALLNELHNKRKIFTSNKAQKIFWFVMFHSIYLQAGSRIAKLRYFSKLVGYGLSLKLSLHYYTHKIFQFS